MISFEKSVGAVVFRKEDNKIKYLLLHYETGHWDFPKGHTEKGESDEETLRREVEEETGIDDIKIIPNFSKLIRYFYRARGSEKEERKRDNRKNLIAKKVIYYIAQTGTGKVTLSFEHIGYKWLDYNEASKKITYEKSKKVLDAANEYLQKLSFD